VVIEKNNVKLAQAGTTGCSFLLLHLTNAALESFEKIACTSQ